MKRILTFCVAASAVFKLYSGVPVRIDLSGREDGVRLERFTASENLYAGYADYLKKEREYLFIATDRKAAGREFTTSAVSFVPSDSGTVKLTFRAGNSRKDTVSRVLVDALEVSGGAVVNPSFEAVENARPVGWNGKGRISSDASDGQNSISVNYHEALSQYIHVTGGQRVTIRFKSKSDGAAK